MSQYSRILNFKKAVKGLLVSPYSDKYIFLWYGKCSENTKDSQILKINIDISASEEHKAKSGLSFQEHSLLLHPIQTNIMSRPLSIQ